MATPLTSTPSNDMWSCESCSWLNKLSIFPICEMCQTDNDTTMDINSTTWSCHECTCDNLISESECAACGSQHGDVLHTRVESDFKQPTTTAPVLERLMSVPVSSMSVAQRLDKDEIDAQCQFIDIVDFCRQNKCHFVDDQFVPSVHATGDTSISQWLRIHKISSDDNDSTTPWTVMSNPQPSDVQQGALGNCWFLAALALITERPHMLAHIVLTKTVNKEGIYLVRLCHNGVWKIVLVDDFFPCTANKQLAYAKASRKQMFVALIEKACAKLLGSYRNLAGGFPSVALQILTGAPSDNIQLQRTNDDDDNNDLLWAKLVSACESNLLMGAITSNSNVPDQEYRRVHLHNKHGYSVLRYHALSSTERFLLMRDPHGSSAYRDDFISHGTLKTLQYVEKAEAAQGTFWISLSALKKFFFWVTVCRYRSELFDMRYEGRFTRNAAQTVNAYYFRLERSSTITLELFHQRSIRKFDARHTQAFVLCDIIKNQIGLQQTILCSDRTEYIEWTGTLPAGAYVVIPFSTSYWNRTAEDNDEIGYTLVIHSFIQFDDVIVTEDLGKLLADCLIAYAVQHHQIIKQTNTHTLYLCQSPGAWLNMIVGENTSTDHILNVDIDVSTSVNVRHSRNEFITRDSIPPQHRQIHLLLEFISKTNQPCKMQYSYNCADVTTERRPSIPTIGRSDDIHALRPIF